MERVYICSYCGRVSTIRASFDIRVKAADDKIRFFCDEGCRVGYLVANIKLSNTMHLNKSKKQ